MAISTSISSNISTSISTSISSGDEGGWSGLTFTSTGTSTIWLNKGTGSTVSCEYSLDKGKTWQAMPTTAPGVTFTSTNPVYVRGNNPNGWTTSQSSYSRFVFGGSDSVNASGSVMSLIDQVGKTRVIPCNSCFYMLFALCSKLLSAPKLPATTLKDSCYSFMFYNCTSLTGAPALPSTTLVQYCYQCMFNNCSALVKAPALPATTLANYCYYSMFSGCTSLNEVHTSAIDTTPAGCINTWLDNTAATGTRTLYTPAYYAGYAQDSTSGCPSGWSRVDAIPAPDNVILYTAESGAGVKGIIGTHASMVTSYFGTSVYVNGVSQTLSSTKSATLKSGANFIVLQAQEHGLQQYQTHLTDLFNMNNFEANPATIKVVDVGHFKFITNGCWATFNECRSLVSVYGWDNLNWYSNCQILNFRLTFQNCRSLLHLPISPTQPYIGEAMYSHNYQVQDEVIEIPASIKAIFPEHAFHKCSVDAHITKAFSVTDNPNFFVGSQGELYGKWKAGSATEAWFLIATPMMAELTNDTFVIDDRCQCLGNLSMSAFGLQRNPSTIQLGDNLVYRPEGFGDRGKGIAPANRGANFVTALFNDTTFTSYAVKSTNTRYSVGADGCLYSKDGSTLLSVPRGFNGNLTINCQKIGAGAFAKDYIWDYPYLTTITIGNNVTEIDQHQIQHLSEMKAAGSHDKVAIDSSHNYFVFDNEYVLRSRKKNHLTFTSTTSTLGQVYIEVESGAPSFQCKYSTDQGSTWTDMPTTSTNAVSIPQSGMWVKGLKVGSTGFADGKVRFNISNTPVKVSGNLSSLIDDGDGNLFYIPTGVTHCFDNLFNSPIASPSAVRTKLDISEVYLPYSEASNYNYTFRNVQCAVLPEIKWPFIHDNFKDCFDNATNTWFKSIRINAWYVGPNAGSGIPTSNPSATVYCHDTELPFIDLNLSKSTRNFAAGKTAKPYDDAGPLKFTSTGNSTISFTQQGTWTGTWPIETSSDGSTWSEYTLGTSISLSAGRYVYFRGQKDSNAQSSSGYHKFGMSGSISASGDCTSLLNGTGGVLDLTPYGTWCFLFLFSSCNILTSAPSLPSLTLTANCYRGMFINCRALTSAPALPATTLTDKCYYCMFQNCISLTQVPALPATTLAQNCYYGMFQGCTSLTSAPSLPAESIVTDCYNAMFKGCTSLTSAPSLPATTLAPYCYREMFTNCSSLSSAPALNAPILLKYCYANMFQGCSLLNKITCLATDKSAENCTSNWLSSVSASGDFYGKSAANWPSGASGIPEGWTRHLD